MGSHVIPLVIVVGILTVTAISALIAAFVNERKTFAGYEEIMDDVRLLKSSLKAEVFRDGNDLVISGTKKNLPVVVRFSYSETTPGLNVRVHAPSAMTLAVVPKGSQFVVPDNLRIAVNTPDDQFNSRFTARTDDGANTKMFLMARVTMKELQKALCSSRTTLSITHGSLDLTETTIPQPYTGRHVVGHIDSLVNLSAVLAQMPGAQLAVVEKPVLPKRFATKTAIAFGAAAAVLSIIGAAQQLREPPPIEKPVNKLDVQERGEGVTAMDRTLVGGLEDFRVVKPNEMDPGVVEWQRAKGVDPSGRVELDLAGSGEAADVSYLLTSPDGQRRLVILSNKRVLFDSRGFGPVSIVRLKKQNFPTTDGKPIINSKGDALLMVQDEKTPEKAVLLYLSPSGSILNQPAPNWSDLDIRQ